MGGRLKRWQLSRDSDCLVGFLLHFRSEVAAFVVRATLQCIVHILKQCVLRRCALLQSVRVSFLASFQSDVRIMGFVKNKGAAWLTAISFVVYFFPPVFRVVRFCFPCWLSNFSSFVGGLKDGHRIPLGLHAAVLLWRMSALASPRTRAEFGERRCPLLFH